MAQGVTVWFTGLSGSGKTTIAKRVEAELKGRGVSVERLDGDVLRQSLTRDLGFSKEDREKNLERATFVAKLLTRNETVVLSAFIAPYKSARDKIRAEIGNYLEVYVKASMDTLISRDLKGLYKKALAGEIKDFTGVDDPYDEPQNPELVLDTDQLSVEECTKKVLALLASRGHIPPVGDLETFEVRPAAGDRSGVEIPGPIAPHGG
ncbi:MAG TPA: adenylyl-sulfate kinase, partial [Limnochordia bacterium]|nr:adenylyl-sulfate kinase [Limnochordia bacterium]